MIIRSITGEISRFPKEGKNLLIIFKAGSTILYKDSIIIDTKLLLLLIISNEISMLINT
tara:strand:+ start:352 stop:528 length:177 start_codon:yes stop_codon:yes gene_type:complete